MTSFRYQLDILSYLESKQLTINWIIFFYLKDTICLDKIYSENVPFVKYFVSNQNWANWGSYLFHCMETIGTKSMQKQHQHMKSQDHPATSTQIH